MITSLQNPKLKWVRTLLAKKNQRYLDRAFVCEGIRLAEEALHYPQAPLLALFSSSISARGMHLIDRCSCDVLEVDAALLDKVSATETSQGLLLVFPFIENPLPPNPDFLLLLDRIKDPGNFGTILRAALAFEVQGMLYTSGSVDPYSPKVVRSAMGAHFRIPLQEVDMEYLSSISHSMQLFLADVKNGSPCWEADLQKPLCLIIGNEAHGVSNAIRQLPHQNLHIPMPGNMESLNAAMSANILLYETVRQRKS
ncbi:MAG: RNA methyltransferase [Chloroflexi bacterium]|nr:RNA methyltransferase [Chloroflexota bacterium]